MIQPASVCLGGGYLARLLNLEPVVITVPGLGTIQLSLCTSVTTTDIQAALSSGKLDAPRLEAPAPVVPGEVVALRPDTTEADVQKRIAKIEATTGHRHVYWRNAAARVWMIAPATPPEKING